MLPMRLFTWSFPQTALIVVSRILKVSRPSRHESGSKNLQNKQGTGGGVSIGSPMLKLVRDIESVKMSVLQTYIFTYLFVSIASLIYEEG